MPNKLSTMFRSTGQFAVRPFLTSIGRVISGELDKRQARFDGQLLSISRRLDTLDNNCRVSQQVLFQQYQLLRKLNLPLPDIQDTGFRVYSQSDEDGLLLFVFSLLGMTNRICVDIASGVPEGANSTNLIRNWGFTGFLFEGNEDKVREAIDFFWGLDTIQCPPQIRQGMVNAENVNDLLLSSQVKGEIDLFSLDMDGIDYWLWKALQVIEPRVVICEFTSAWGPDKSLTIPYDPEFTRPHMNYWGASLAAFVKLGHQKGYRFVGWSRYGFNAIFVRKDLGVDVLPEVSPQQCLQDPLVQRWKARRFADFPDTTKHPWIEV
jgi:hypothetical protein